MKHIAIYTRVSHHTQDTESQLPELRAWASRQREPVKWYEDVWTGKTMDRPQWQLLEQAITQGLVSQVTVWKLDRFGRTSLGLIRLRDLLLANEVKVHSLHDSIDLDTPAGRLTWGVLAAVAEYELEIRKERTTAGIAAAKAKAGGKCPWGGRKEGALNHHTRDVKGQVHRLKRQGYPISNIAKIVGLSRQTIYNLLEAS